MQTRLQTAERERFMLTFLMCAAMLFLASCSSDYASINEFICQANMEGINAVLIDEDVPLGNRQTTYTNGSEKAVEIIRKKCNVRNIIHTSFAYLGS